VSVTFNLAESVYKYFLKQPDALAVCDPNGCLTFGQLAEQASIVSNQIELLLTDGKPGRIALMASRNVDACVGLLGICWSGASYVPINLKWPIERIAEVIRRCEISVIVTDDQGLQKLTPDLIDQLSAKILHVGKSDSGLLEFIDIKKCTQGYVKPPANMFAKDVAYLIFTSGTTAEPKGVVVNCGAVRHYCKQISEVLGLKQDDRVLETCEMSFDVSVHNMFVTWEVGAQVHILPATQVMNAVKFVNQAKLTVWNSVPSLAGMLIQIKALAPDSLRRLRLTVFGGEQLAGGVAKSWRAAAPNSRIFNLYGPTEATVFCAYHELTNTDIQGRNEGVISIGKSLAGSELAILTDGRLHQDPNTRGELLISGKQLADEYFRRADLTAVAFVMINDQRWYRTGDLAQLDSDGMFHCLGRLDNQVKVMGHRVELEEIDAHVRRVSGSQIVASVAWPIDKFGNATGTVCFVLGENVNDKDLISKLRHLIPAYMIPARIIGIAEFPFNASGKADRKALRQLLSQQIV
jgi:D-alanine--poly(phosphoribitol) ligase subunit 1